MSELSGASRLQEELALKMFPAAIGSYPCLRVDFPVTPKVCEQRARRWVAEGRKRPICAGEHCTHWRQEFADTPADQGPRACPQCGEEMRSAARLCGDCHQRRIRMSKPTPTELRAVEPEAQAPDPLPPCADCGGPAMSPTSRLCKSCRGKRAHAAGDRVKAAKRAARKATPERDPLPEGLHYTRSGKVCRGTNYMHRCPECGDWTRKDRGACSKCKGTLARAEAKRARKGASEIQDLRELAEHQVGRWLDTGDRDALVEAFEVLYAYFRRLNNPGKGGDPPNTGQPVRTP